MVTPQEIEVRLLVDNVRGYLKLSTATADAKRVAFQNIGENNEKSYRGNKPLISDNQLVAPKC